MSDHPSGAGSTRIADNAAAVTIGTLGMITLARAEPDPPTRAIARTETDSSDSDPPAARGAYRGCRLTPDGDGVLASWIEPGDRGNQSIRFSRFGASLDDDGSDLRWSEARTVHDGNGLFANWADRPAVRIGALGRRD